MLKRIGFKVSALINFNINFILSTRERSTYSRRNMRENEGSKIIIHPELGSHSASVILLHGLGDSAEGWVDTAEELSKQFPYIKFILPTATEIPVTLNRGMLMPAWYDITGLTPDRASELCDGLEASVEVVKDIIKSELSHGVLSNRILLAGFSQGGARR